MQFLRKFIGHNFIFFYFCFLFLGRFFIGCHSSSCYHQWLFSSIDYKNFGEEENNWRDCTLRCEKGKIQDNTSLVFHIFHDITDEAASNCLKLINVSRSDWDQKKDPIRNPYSITFISVSIYIAMRTTLK